MQFLTLENQLRCGIVVVFACKLKYVFSYQAINVDSGQFQFQANLVRTCNIVTTSSNGPFNETTTFLIPVQFVITKLFLTFNFLFVKLNTSIQLYRSSIRFCWIRKYFLKIRILCYFRLHVKSAKCKQRLWCDLILFKTHPENFLLPWVVLKNNYNRFKSILLSAHQIISDHIKYFKSQNGCSINLGKISSLPILFSHCYLAKQNWVNQQFEPIDKIFYFDSL